MSENILFGKIKELDLFKTKGVNRFAIVDANAASILAEQGILLNVEKYILESSEDVKNLHTIGNIISWLLEKEAGRDSLLLGIGGGIVTDITGFVASIYKRGIAYALIPTTLLAQVDASVGGKTGVNFAGLKNVVGTFSTPESIIIDIEWLKTLPQKELRSGLAEVLKTFLIADAEMYEETVAFFNSKDIASVCMDEEYAFVEKIVRRCIDIKSRIVGQDRVEKGLRRVLNLGHTIGHAIEAYMQETGSASISHGEAVAAGIIAQAHISAHKNICSQITEERIETDFSRLGYKSVRGIADTLGIGYKDDFAKKLIEFIRNDKKRNEDFINFVLVSDIGAVKIEPISIEILEQEIYDLR